jgi:hypothetical protein
MFLEVYNTKYSPRRRLYIAFKYAPEIPFVHAPTYPQAAVAFWFIYIAILFIFHSPGNASGLNCALSPSQSLSDHTTPDAMDPSAPTSRLKSKKNKIRSGLSRKEVIKLGGIKFRVLPVVMQCITG